MRLSTIISLLNLIILSQACSQAPKDKSQLDKSFEITKSEKEWKTLLTPAQYHILREKGTEPAFTGPLWNNHKMGTYTCAGCQLPLFSSKTKFESGTGWPSFYQPITEDAIDVVEDNRLGMTRDEVVCARCGGHLGHVFKEGTKPTGLRYCLNSAALNFEKKQNK